MMHKDPASSEETTTRYRENEIIARTILTLDEKTISDEALNYKPLYYFLFNGINDVINTLKDSDQKTAAALKQLHCDAEDLFSELIANPATPLTKSKSST